MWLLLLLIFVILAVEVAIDIEVAEGFGSSLKLIKETISEFSKMDVKFENTDGVSSKVSTFSDNLTFENMSKLHVNVF